MNRGFWFTSGVLAGTIVGFGSALVFTQQQADTQSLAEADAEVEDADVMLAAQMQR